MRDNRAKSVLLVAEGSDPGFHHGVAQYARQAGWHLNIDGVYSDDLLWGWGGDGCIAVVKSDRILSFSESLEIPVVGVTYERPDVFTRIHEDDEAIGKLAADYLLGLGFKHFASYRTGPQDVGEIRESSFVSAVKKAGAQVTPLFWKRPAKPKGKDWAQRNTWLARKLKALSKPAAVFCIDDRMAVTVIEACQDSGIRVPDDIAVLGVGCLEIASACCGVSLSSIRVDFRKLGFQAAELLDRVLDGEKTPTDTVLLAPEGIEERRSTYTLAVDDPAARKAIRFMLDNFTSPIGIPEMLEVAGITRRQLTYITEKELNRTPARLLEDTRIDKACELLETTNFPIKRVAYETGLGNALRLQRIFRKRLQTTPTDWRRGARNNQSTRQA